jgi:hypothetical protein
MSQIAQLCDKIAGHLTKVGSPIADLLHPGVSEAQIQRIETTLPFTFPISIVEMYKWRNGTDRTLGSESFPWWTFDQIDLSVESYHELTRSIPDDSWNDHWFPMFSTSDVSCYGIQCSDENAIDGPIVHFEYLTGTNDEFVNLEAMLRTILIAYETHVIFMSEDSDIDVDDIGFAEIARNLNPGIKRWEA